MRELLFAIVRDLTTFGTPHWRVTGDEWRVCPESVTTAAVAPKRQSDGRRWLAWPDFSKPSRNLKYLTTESLR
jgi:hypothetical protein